MLAAFLLAASLSVGPEIPLAEPVLEPAPFDRQGARVASNGKDFLVVWSDRRNPAAVPATFAARVSADGTLLDPAGIAIGPAFGYGSAASDGDDYVVTFACAYTDSCLARISAETGAITYGARLPLARNAVIASNGDGYVVAYQQHRNEPNLGPMYAVAIGSDANLAGAPFLIGAAPYPPSIVSNGDTYFVTWSIYPHLEGRLISSSAPAAPLVRLTNDAPSYGPGPFSYAVASNGDDYLVAWQQNLGLVNNGYVTDLRAAVVTRAGTAGPPRTIVSGTPKTFYPAVTWNGSRYVITYTAANQSSAPYLFHDTASDVARVVVNEQIEVTAAPAAVSPRITGAVTSTIASNGSTSLVAWQHVAGSHSSIEARLLQANDAVVEPDATPIVVAKSVTWQESLDGTLNGSQVIVAWEEISGEPLRRRVFTQRVGANGVLDGRGVPVAESAGEQRRPAIGGSYVAWVETRAGAVFAKRYGTNDAPLRIGEAWPESTAAIAAIGNMHLIAWETKAHRVVVARVRDGVLLDAQPIALADADTPQYNARIATDGLNFLVTFEQETGGYGCIDFWPCRPPGSLQASLVLPAGIVAGAPATIAVSDATTVDLVWNGTEFAVMWNSFVQRVARNGMPIGERRAIGSYGPAAAFAWNGREYLVASYDGPRLRVARYDTSFALIDSVLAVYAPFPIAYPIERQLVLVPRDASGSLLGYRSRWSDGVSRAAARWIGERLPPARRRSVSRR